MKLFTLIAILIFSLSYNKCSAQLGNSSGNLLHEVPENYYSKVDQKLTSLNNKLTKKSIKYLEKFRRQENKLKEQLGKVNAHETNTFAKANAEYTTLISQLNADTAIENGVRGAYNAYLDTLSTSLCFLKQFNNSGINVTRPQQSLQALQSKLEQSEKVKEFIALRKQQLKDLLSKYTKLPKGLSKEYASLSKTAHYYSAQVNEYKNMLKNPANAEREALTLLNKLPAFKKFMQKNSQLASLFRLPDGSGTAESLAGLQTRAAVQGSIQQRFSTGGPDAQQIIQQNIAQARSELNNLKEKLLKFSPRGNDLEADEMPDFRSNSQKTKSFLKRLEYGANVEFAKSSNRFPSSTSIGLSLGYKKDDKSVIGIGMSYKMGMGTLRHVVISHQGIGLRSFADYKIKRSLWFGVGAELNYWSTFQDLSVLKKLAPWQKSILAGLTKKARVGKKTVITQLLYDFLCAKQVANTNPLKMRVGYNF